MVQQQGGVRNPLGMRPASCNNAGLGWKPMKTWLKAPQFRTELQEDMDDRASSSDLTK